MANHQAKGELKTPQQLSGKLTVLPKAYLFVNTVTLDGNALFGFVDQIQRSIKLHLVRRSQAISNDIQRGLLQPTENDAVFGLGKYGIRHLEPRGLGLQGGCEAVGHLLPSLVEGLQQGAQFRGAKRGTTLAITVRASIIWRNVVADWNVPKNKADWAVNRAGSPITNPDTGGSLPLFAGAEGYGLFTLLSVSPSRVGQAP